MIGDYLPPQRERVPRAASGDLLQRNLRKRTQLPRVAENAGRHQTAFAYARRADYADLPGDCTLQQPLNGGHLPPPTDHLRLSTTDRAVLVAHAQQLTGGHRFLGTFNTDHLRFTESRCAINQPSRGLTEHDPARRRRCFHPLSHTDLLTNGGITQGQERQTGPVAVNPRPPSPLGSTSVSCHCWSTMSVISPGHLRHEVLRPSGRPGRSRRLGGEDRYVGYAQAMDAV
jgi:hypothetical protein